MFYSRLNMCPYCLKIRKFGIFIFFLFFVFIAKSQPTASSMNLKGNVRILYAHTHIAKDIVVKDNVLVSYQKGKLINHTDYIFDKNGLLLAENNFNNEDIIDISYIYIYDESDRLIEETRAQSGKFQLGRTEYMYDKNGRKIKKIIYDQIDSLKNTIIYAYDSLGNLYSEKTYSKVGRITKEIYYQHDQRGNLIFVNSVKTDIPVNKPYQEVQKFDDRNNLIYKSYIKEDTLKWEYTAHYNKKDSLIYEETKDGQGKITYYSTLKFNKDKRVSMMQYHLNRETLNTETYYKYDKKGKPLSEKVYTENKKELLTIRTFFYDEKENWIYCLEENKKNNTNIVYSRRINYF